LSCLDFLVRIDILNPKALNGKPHIHCSFLPQLIARPRARDWSEEEASVYFEWLLSVADDRIQAALGSWD